MQHKYSRDAEPGDGCRVQHRVCFTPINIKGFESWRRGHALLNRSKESMIKAGLSIARRPHRRNVWNLCLRWGLIFPSFNLGNVSFFTGSLEARTYEIFIIIIILFWPLKMISLGTLLRNERGKLSLKLKDNCWQEESARNYCHQQIILSSVM